jgi:hypothetical protein
LLGGRVSGFARPAGAWRAAARCSSIRGIDGERRSDISDIHYQIGDDLSYPVPDHRGREMPCIIMECYLGLGQVSGAALVQVCFFFFFLACPLVHVLIGWHPRPWRPWSPWSVSPAKPNLLASHSHSHHRLIKGEKYSNHHEHSL